MKVSEMFIPKKSKPLAEIGASPVVGEKYILPVNQGEDHDVEVELFLINIVGVVIPGTVEYNDGLRYFDQNGHLYNSLGITEDTDDKGNIFKNRLHKLPGILHYGYSENKITVLTRFRSEAINGVFDTSDSNRNFETLCLGGVYADRMGFAHLMDVYAKEENCMGTGAENYYCIDTGRWNGEEKQPSMFDLIHRLH